MTAVLAATVPPRARRLGPLALRGALTAFAAGCVAIHVWVAVSAPGWHSIAMLVLAAACAACLVRPSTALPSTGEWAWMTGASLAMLLVHLAGLAPAGGHHRTAGMPSADAAGVVAGTAHAVALWATALEFGIAMTALAVCGVLQRRR